MGWIISQRLINLPCQASRHNASINSWILLRVWTNALDSSTWKHPLFPTTRLNLSKLCNRDHAINRVMETIKDEFVVKFKCCKTLWVNTSWRKTVETTLHSLQKNVTHRKQKAGQIWFKQPIRRAADSGCCSNSRRKMGSVCKSKGTPSECVVVLHRN